MEPNTALETAQAEALAAFLENQRIERENAKAAAEAAAQAERDAADRAAAKITYDKEQACSQAVDAIHHDRIGVFVYTGNDSVERQAHFSKVTERVTVDETMLTRRFIPVEVKQLAEGAYVQAVADALGMPRDSSAFDHLGYLPLSMGLKSLWGGGDRGVMTAMSYERLQPIVRALQAKS